MSLTFAKCLQFLRISAIIYTNICIFSHVTGTSGWLPPQSSWDGGGTGLPFGWEAANDKEGRVYYVKWVMCVMVMEKGLVKWVKMFFLHLCLPDSRHTWIGLVNESKTNLSAWLMLISRWYLLLQKQFPTEGKTQERFAFDEKEGQVAKVRACHSFHRVMLKPVESESLSQFSQKYVKTSHIFFLPSSSWILDTMSSRFTLQFNKLLPKLSSSWYLALIESHKPFCLLCLQKSSLKSNDLR